MNSPLAGSPKTIWIFWSQGWKNAPHVAKSALETWRHYNPTWTVQALDQERLRKLFTFEIPTALLRDDIPIEAYSDILRIELLARFGGVWVDATTLCTKPLDDWVYEYGKERGFFAFSRPGPDRLISSWFLFSEAGGYMIRVLQELVTEYWAEREQRDSYFWLNDLFAKATVEDKQFEALWKSSNHISARHRLHFGANAPRLNFPPAKDDLDLLDSGNCPVIKLTHKLEQNPNADALMTLLMNQHKK